MTDQTPQDDDHGFDVEFVQTDPEGSPTPGYAHHAGHKFFPTLDEARTYAQIARQSIGQPVPEDVWAPCCEWQTRETPVASIVIVSYPHGEFSEVVR